MALAMVVAILGLTLSLCEDYATILHLLLAKVEIPFAGHAFVSFCLSWLQGALLQSCELSQIFLARHVHSPRPAEPVRLVRPKPDHIFQYMVG